MDSKRDSKPTCSEKEHANMVNRTSIWELEISMSFVDLLKVCLQEATSYATSEHVVESATIQEIQDIGDSDRVLG